MLKNAGSLHIFEDDLRWKKKYESFSWLSGRPNGINKMVQNDANMHFWTLRTVTMLPVELIYLECDRLRLIDAKMQAKIRLKKEKKGDENIAIAKKMVGESEFGQIMYAVCSVHIESKTQ